MKYLKTYEYISNYINFYQEAYDKIYEPEMGEEELIYRMIEYLKDNGIGNKLAVPYMAYDIETWFDSKKFKKKI